MNLELIVSTFFLVSFMELHFYNMVSYQFLGFASSQYLWPWFNEKDGLVPAYSIPYYLYQHKFNYISDSGVPIQYDAKSVIRLPVNVRDPYFEILKLVFNIKE